MKAHLTRRYHFSSSHRLNSTDMSPEENLATYGKCNNPHGHGHNYTLEVTVSGPVDPRTGMVCNLVDLDTFVEREVLSRYHLENLNTLKEFAQTGAHDGKSLGPKSSKYCSAASTRASGKSEARRNHDELLRVHRHQRVRR